MKVITQRAVPSFEPIELTITIESEDELLDLYHRCNVSQRYIEKGSTSSRPRPFPQANHTPELWALLGSLLDSLDE